MKPQSSGEMTMMIPKIKGQFVNYYKQTFSSKSNDLFIYRFVYQCLKLKTFARNDQKDEK